MLHFIADCATLNLRDWFSMVERVSILRMVWQHHGNKKSDSPNLPDNESTTDILC